MKTFDKSSKLDHVAYDIRGPVLDEANRMIANGEKILRLNTGNPAEFGFTAPDEVIRDLIMNVRNSEGYSDSFLRHRLALPFPDRFSACRSGQNVPRNQSDF